MAAGRRTIGWLPRLWLRSLSRVVPAERRQGWVREWTAELSAEAGRLRRFRLAIGAQPDAFAVRAASRRTAVAGPRGGGSGPLTGAGVELRRAVRSLGRSPAFTAAAVITLGVGLGATAAIFTLVDAILLRPLPYPAPERLVRVEHTMEQGGTNSLARFTWAFFEAENRSFEAFGGYWPPGTITVAAEGAAERVTGVQATPALLEVLGGSPVAGRLFDERDAESGAGAVVISERLWRRQFGGDPGVIGTTMLVEGEAREILGVIGAGADLPDREVDLWIPYAVPEGVRVDDAFRINVIARLRPDVGVEAAEADVRRLTRRLPEFGSFYATYIDELGLETRVRPLREEVVGDLERSLWILLAAVGIVLLIAGANVSMLFLVRSESRRGEVAVRAALGAGRSRLILSFLSESVFLAFAAGLLGLLLAFGAVRLLLSFAPPTIPRLDEIRLGGATIGLLAALSVLWSFALALYPALRFGRARPGGTRGASGPDRATAAAGSTLVVIQVALALVLLSGAALLLQTFRNLRAVDPGFDAKGVLIADLSLPSPAYPEPERVRSFQEQLIDRIEALPGVRRAALGPSPLGIGGCNGLYVQGMALREGEFPPCVPVAYVGPGYWEVLGVPVEAGRAFADADLDQPPVAVITSNAAERLWPGGDATAGGVSPAPRRGPPFFPVVGVVGAVRGRGPDQPLTETVFLPVASAGDAGQVLRTTGVVVAVESGRETALVPALRSVMRELDPTVPLTVSGTLEDELARSMVRSSFTLFLLATSAATAVILGLVGLYGVVAYRVETRRAEIGIRMAIGAHAADVRAMVMRHSMRLIAIGTVVGLAAALLLTQTLSTLLFGVSPADPPTLGLAALALAAAAAAATWLPAQRATRVNPVDALHD